MSTIDLRRYVHGVRVHRDHAVVLALRLRSAAPVLDPLERTALDRVVRVAREVNAVLARRESAAREKLKPHLVRFADGWRTLRDLLAALAVVRGPRGVRAEKLRRALFPRGLSFVTSDAPSAWAAGARSLQRVEEDALRGELALLAGEDVVAEVEASTRALGEALLHCSRRRRDTELKDKLAELTDALGAYCRRLMANVDLSDARSVARFQAAIAPIDVELGLRPFVAAPRAATAAEPSAHVAELPRLEVRIAVEDDDAPLLPEQPVERATREAARRSSSAAS